MKTSYLIARTLTAATAALLALLSGLAFLSENADAADVAVPTEQVVSAPPQFDAIANEIQDRVAKGEFPSFAVGVIRDGSVVWAQTFGWADREAHRPARATTAYGLASVGKTMTATAAMTLVEQGKIGLDDKVAQLLEPDRFIIYEGPSEGPSLRQLLNMTAGIPHGALTYTDAHAASAVSEEQILQHRALVVFPPGVVFHYSNFSIATVDHLIQILSGRSFGDYLSEAVFKPLGMHQAFVASNRTTDRQPIVRYDDDGTRLGAIYPFPRSSRGIYASLNDLLSYAAFNLKRPRVDHVRILSDEAIDTMHNARSSVPGAYMALGWGSLDLANGIRWNLTDGRDLGVQSVVSIIPSAGIAVICLTNVTGGQADRISLQVTDVLVPGFARQAEAVVQSIEDADTQFRPSDPWLGLWRGTIKTSTGDLSVAMNFEKGRDVRISIENQYPTLLDEPHYGRGLLSGAFLAKLPLEEIPSHYHRVELGLRLDGDRLSGFAFANFTNERGHFELPTYISLTRGVVR